VQQLQIPLEHAWQAGTHIDRLACVAAPKQVTVAVRERHHISGGEGDAIFAFQLHVRAAVADEVIDDHVSAASREHGREQP